MAKKIPSIVFSLPSLKLENIVLEIIDNSLDYGAKNVQLQFFEGKTSGRKKDVGFAVFDDGVGFKTGKNLFAAFEITEDENQKQRKADDIGKYHVGMKLAPLSMFKHLFVFAKLDGEVHFCYASNPNETETVYDMDDSTHSNPTLPKVYAASDKSIPEEVHEIIKTFETGDWNTCVVTCHRVKDIIDDGREPVQSFITTDVGAKHFNQVLGMTYQKYLEKKEPPHIEVLNPVTNKFETTPCIDPFWKDFTAVKFTEQKAKYEAELTKSTDDEEKDKLAKKIYFCDVMGKLGTFQGYTHTSGILKGLKITPYVVPSPIVRTILKEKLEPGIRWEEDDKTYPLQRAIDNAPSRALNSEFVGGFFFYRDNRLINYGSFYDLGIPTNDANSIRIEVEYPSTIDTNIVVAPNKDRINKFTLEAWDEIMRGLMQPAGGSEYATPFNQSIPFFIDSEEGRKTPTKKKKTPNSVAHFPNVLVRNSSEKGVVYTKCAVKECGLAHVPGEICPKLKCSTCGLAGKGCTSKNCTFVCKTCTKTGECTPTACVYLCDTCKKVHEKGQCQAKCSGGCGKTVSDCECACSLCGKKHEKGACEKVCDKCKNELDKCSCEQGDSTVILKGPKVTLKLWKKNKNGNISLIKEGLEKLGIKPDELK